MDLSTRPENIPYPGPDWRPSTAYAVKSAIARLVTSPDMVLAQWWQAVVNPGYLDSNDVIVNGQPEFNRVQRLNPNRADGLYPIVVGSEQLNKSYYRQGTWENGSVPITYYATDMPLAPFDWVIPLGSNGHGDSITFPEKQNCRRGEKVAACLGTVSNTGTAVTGSGTSFDTTFRAGDLIQFVGQAYPVLAVLSPTSLILATVPESNITSFPYFKLTERLLYPPVASITQIVDASGVIYRPGIDYVLASDMETIQWLSPTSPSYNVRFGVSYTYRPKYEITDLGQKRRLNGGLKQLDIQNAKVWKPENLGR